MTYGWFRTPAWDRFTPLSHISDATAGPSKMKLWDYYERATGNPLYPRDQLSSSSCVGQATATAVDIVRSIRISGLGISEVFSERSDAIGIYAGSRHEIGRVELGRKIWGKGSHVPYAAMYVQQYGSLFMKKYPQVDLSDFSSRLCTEWESKGVPDDLEPEAKLHPVKDWVAVKSYDEAVVAISNGWPVVIGCSYGFKSQPVRDSDGFLKPKGTWNHAQVWIGSDQEYKRPGLCLMNSWGNFISDENARESIPAGSYWVDAEVCDDMIKSGEAVALSNAVGFPKQDLKYNLL